MEPGTDNHSSILKENDQKESSSRIPVLMRALRVDVKTQVTVLINDDDDYWAIKHNAMQQVHDDIHWHLKDKFIIDYSVT